MNTFATTVSVPRTFEGMPVMQMVEIDRVAKHSLPLVDAMDIVEAVKALVARATGLFATAARPATAQG